MTKAEFDALCQKEWDNGFGDVTELHLDEHAHNELRNSIIEAIAPANGSYPAEWDYRDLARVVNPVTRTACEVFKHQNHAIVRRVPPPPPASHKVYV